jgi:acetolactate synthase-1/2/3 large subunit
MTGAELLVDMLVRYGVDTIFGVPGDTSVSFYNALQQRSKEIRHVMARDERSAGFMADAYARLTNRPAVFECPSGAGAMYSLPPLAEANDSSVPVILLTIDLPLAAEGRGVLTELDCARLFAPVTKLSTQVKLASKLPETVRRAFRTACSGKPGAVHLQIPEDLLSAAIDPSGLSLHVQPECQTYPAFRTAASHEDVQAVLAAIDASSRPVFVAGGGVNRSQAGEALTAAAQALAVPVVTTLTGQHALPQGHPLLFGVAGDNGYQPAANLALEDADLVIVLGSKVGSVLTMGGTFPSTPLHGRTIQVDIDPGCLGNNVHNRLSIAADARSFLRQLVAAVPAGRDGATTSRWIASLHDERCRCLAAQAAMAHADSAPLHPARVFAELSERIERADVPFSILSDAGTPTPYSARFLRLGHPHSRFAVPRAFGGLGYALPAVVGAWHADRTRRPIALFGDGSFNMSLGEIETLVRLQVPALLVLFNNSTFGWIKGLQCLRGDQPFDVDFDPARGNELAAAFGLRSWSVRTPDDLGAALDLAFAHDGPCLLDVHVESIAETLPPVASWEAKAKRLAALATRTAVRTEAVA